MNQTAKPAGNDGPIFPRPTEVDHFTFAPRRSKIAVLLLGSLTLAYIGYDLATTPDAPPDAAKTGMVVGIAFALWAAYQAWQLMPGRILLHFDNKGLTYRGPFTKSFWPWEDFWRPSAVEQSLVTVSKEYWVCFPLKTIHAEEPTWLITHRNADGKVPASTFVKKEAGCREMTKMVEAWRAHFAGPIHDVDED